MTYFFRIQDVLRQILQTLRNVNILEWWKSHSMEFPLLSRCARYILAIPASSATSERIFSAGGLTVTNLRNSLVEDMVQDLLMIKLNLEKVEAMEAMEERRDAKRKRFSPVGEKDLDQEELLQSARNRSQENVDDEVKEGLEICP